MATITKENYLKALYLLHQKDSSISVSDLGKVMGVSKPTVNDMIKKLQVIGWLNYEKYKPLSLTPKGLKDASKIVRRHRLSEMFLVEIMGFGWEEVHEIAEELEHIKIGVFFDKMDELMNYPKVDPHGSPIPDKNGNYNEPNYKLLSQIPKNTKVVLRALKDSSSEFLHYLTKKDLLLGTEIVVKDVESFDKSMRIVFGQKEEIISYSVSNNLLVEVL